MLIKEDGDKVNFIDKNDNFIGYDTGQSCCEYAGWYIADSITSDEEKAIDKVMSDGYFFDTSKNPIDVDVEDGGYYDDGGCVAFELTNDNGDKLYLHLFNHHNGYYCHGWNSNVFNGGLL